jgi:dephospho-CoA kinase
MKTDAGRPVLIGLTGTNGAGKGEVAAHLKGRGYAHLSLSDILREELAARGLEAGRDNLIRIGNELRTAHGPEVLARRTMDRVRGPSVIDSIRNPREVEFFRKQKGFVLLAVDAPIEVRYARTRARGRDESTATFDEFRRKEALEMAGNETDQQLALCMAMADRTIFNDGTIEELRRKVEELL